MNRFWIFILVGCLLMPTGPALAESETKTYTGPWGVEYRITFDEGSERIEVFVKNPTTRVQHIGFSVGMDKYYWRSESLNIGPNESRSFSYDLTEGVNVVVNEHSVRFLAGSGPLWFNYTKDIDTETTEVYPTPEITNVSLETTTFRGEERTIINVSAHNPSGRFYTLIIRAFTFETSGYYNVIKFSPHNSSSEQIILNEKPGELVAGEVRMYDGNFSSGEGAFDQVEIYGRSSGDTEWSHEKYQTVVPPWESDDHYVYTNESLHREKIGAPETLKESPIAWIGAAALLLLGFWKLRNFRR